MTPLWCLHFQLWRDFTQFSSASISDFEQENAK